ncbi:tetratricopeptide repeat protein [Undibacterium sp. TC4M20W]
MHQRAEQGDIDAQNIFATMHLKGIGGKANYAEALKWVRKAAEQGDAVAQSNLATMYAQGLGVTKNDAEALNWFRKSASRVRLDAPFFYAFLIIEEMVRQDAPYKKTTPCSLQASFFIVPTRVTHEPGDRLTSYLPFRTTTLSLMSCGFLRQRNVSGRRFWLT